MSSITGQTRETILNQQPSIEAKEVARKEQKTEQGVATIAYDVSIGGRSFTVKVGFSQEYLENFARAENLGEDGVASVIDKIVNQLHAKDIVELSGKQIKTNLNDRSQTTVYPLSGTGESKTLEELANGSEEQTKLHESVSSVIDTIGKIRGPPKPPPKSARAKAAALARMKEGQNSNVENREAHQADRKPLPDIPNNRSQTMAEGAKTLKETSDSGDHSISFTVHELANSLNQSGAIDQRLLSPENALLRENPMAASDDFLVPKEEPSIHFIATARGEHALSSEQKDILSAITDEEIQTMQRAMYEKADEAETSKTLSREIDGMGNLDAAIDLLKKEAQLQKLMDRLTDDPEIKTVLTKTGIKKEEYAEAIETILFLENSGISSISRKIQDADGKAVEVRTSFLLQQILSKKRGRAALINNQNLFDKVVNHSLKLIEGLSDGLRNSIASMPKKSEHEKKRFLPVLSQARDIAARYHEAARGMPVTEKISQPIGTSSITLDDGENKPLQSLLDETFTTELSYLEEFDKLNEKIDPYGNIIEKMHSEGLISANEAAIFNIQWEQSLKEGTLFLCELAGIQYDPEKTLSENREQAKGAFEQLTTEKKLQNTVHAFRPERQNAIGIPFAAHAIRQKTTSEIMGRVLNQKAGIALKNIGQDLSSRLILPIQRPLRYVMLLNEIIKNSPPSAVDQLNGCLEHAKINAAIINSVTPA